MCSIWTSELLSSRSGDGCVISISTSTSISIFISIFIFTSISIFASTSPGPFPFVASSSAIYIIIELTFSPTSLRSSSWCRFFTRSIEWCNDRLTACILPSFPNPHKDK